MSRLKAEWATEHAGWARRDLTEQRYVYWWADGIHTGVREEDDPNLCLLVITCLCRARHGRQVGVRLDGT